MSEHYYFTDGRIGRSSMDAEQTTIVEADARAHVLINGVAGSGKTKVMVERAARLVQLLRVPVLFLTKVGSVTAEIKDRLQSHESLGCPVFRQRGKQGHYLAHWDGVPLAISNLDAWVHQTLLRSGVDVAGEGLGACHEAKIRLLLARGKVAVDRIPHTDATPGLVFLDEVQGFDQASIDAVVAMVRRTGSYLTAAGDLLQTLSMRDPTTPSMAYLGLALGSIHRAYLTVCYRCPPSHVALLRHITGPFCDTYGLPVMRAAETQNQNQNPNQTDRPVLGFLGFFDHGALSGETRAQAAAEMVVRILHQLLATDETVGLDDIAVLHRNVKDVLVFSYLERLLPAMFALHPRLRPHLDHLSPPGPVIVLRSRQADGSSAALDWDRARGRAKLMSITGARGRGFRAVVLLGVTEGCLPWRNELFRETELCAQSCLNVGLSRSSRHLFVGIAGNMPSRYLLDVLAHHPKLWTERETHWKDLLASPPDISGLRSGYLQKGPLGPGSVKSLLTVREISEDMEFPPPPNTGAVAPDAALATPCEVVQFGNPLNMDIGQSQSVSTGPGTTPVCTCTSPHYALIWGQLAQLVLWSRFPDRLAEVRRTMRYWCLDARVNPQPRRLPQFTSDERLLACLADLLDHRGDPVQDLDDYFRDRDHRRFFEHKDQAQLRADVQAFHRRRAPVLHTRYSDPQFQSDLALWLMMDVDADGNTPMKDDEGVPEEVQNRSAFWWNLALLSTRPMPGYWTMFNFAGADIDGMTANIDALLARFRLSGGTSMVFETPVSLVCGTFTEEERKAMRLKPGTAHSAGIQGRIDGWDHASGTLLELKASSQSDFGPAWFSQAMMYRLLSPPDRAVRRVVVANVVAGEARVWNVPAWRDGVQQRTLQAIIRERVAPAYRWHRAEVAGVLRSLWQR